MHAFGYKLPKWFLKKKFVEASAIALDPEYVEQDVFRGLIHTMGRLTIESGHRYVIQRCPDPLLPTMLGLGFRKMGAYSALNSQGDLILWHIIVVDVIEAIQGKSAGFFDFNLQSNNRATAPLKTRTLRLRRHQSLRVGVLDRLTPLVKRTHPLHKKRRSGTEARQGLAG